MTQAAEPIPFADQQHLVLSDVSWRLYDTLLQEITGRPLRVSYYKGRIEIMSPLPKHDKWKWRIGRMIGILTLELNIPMTPLGSTTFRREDEEVGLEPDDCFYIEHAAAVHDKDRIELPADPPPDLAVEIDITHRSVAREPIYAALGVPELWRFDGTRLAVLGLTADGKYEERPTSRAFPLLPMDEFRHYLDLMRTTDDTTAMRQFQQWVRSSLTGR
jgi:Uma2 family endonuclease